MIRRALLLSAALCAEPAYAQEQSPSAEAAGSEAHELAKQLNNPVANLISVPFQENVDFSVGPEEGTR